MTTKKRIPRVVAVALAMVLMMALAVPGFAAEAADYHAETQPAAFTLTSDEQPLSSRAYETWMPQGTKEIKTSLGVHFHTPKMFTFRYDSSRLVGCSTTHKANSGAALYGYSRARFESVLNGADAASDSGRQWRTGSSSAQTPYNPYNDGLGWSGIAKTYCGDSTTI